MLKACGAISNTTIKYFKYTKLIDILTKKTYTILHLLWKHDLSNRKFVCKTNIKLYNLRHVVVVEHISP